MKECRRLTYIYTATTELNGVMLWCSWTSVRTYVLKISGRTSLVNLHSMAKNYISRFNRFFPVTWRIATYVQTAVCRKSTTYVQTPICIKSKVFTLLRLNFVDWSLMFVAGVDYSTWMIELYNLNTNTFIWDEKQAETSFRSRFRNS